jgi:hypothetical protein
LARTLAIDDPAAGAEAFARLATRHAEAYEWLQRLGSGDIVPEDWLEYRIDPPR